MKQWLSPAKLNLFLYITGQRPDGYHNLQTLFQFVDYYDTLTFEPRNDGVIHLVTPFSSIEHDRNLIVIAAKKLQAFSTNLMLGANITINKQIPMGGGLGGASSNAATSLVALNEIWQLNLSKRDLCKIGKSIGADVPIFIYGHAALAQGIGDEFTFANPTEYWYLITCPNIEISTAAIFNDPSLIRNTPIKMLTELQRLAETDFKNDCEATVRSRYPIIDKLINHLSAYAPTRLTGTGACIFSQCKNKAHAKQLQQHLNPFSVDSFITKGTNTFFN